MGGKLLIFFITLVWTTITFRVYYVTLSKSDEHINFKPFKLVYQQHPVDKVEKYEQSCEGTSMHSIKMVLRESGKKGTVLAEVKNNLPPRDIGFHFNNSQFCQSQPVDVLLYVLSSPRNHKQRDAVRETWGKADQRNGRQYRTLFFVGVNERVNSSKLETEMEEHRDLVQVDIPDSYFNLTLKGISAIQWMSTYCPDVQYVIKIDDDVVLNPDYLDRIMGTLILREENKPAVKVLCSKLWFRTKPAPNGYKNYMPSNMMKVYPTYCNGNLYGYPGWLLRLLRLAAHHTPIFPIEDIYTMGLLLPQLNVDGLMLIEAKDLVQKELSKIGPNRKW